MSTVAGRICASSLLGRPALPVEAGHDVPGAGERGRPRGDVATHMVEMPVSHDDDVDRVRRDSEAPELGLERAAGAAEGMLHVADARVHKDDGIVRVQKEAPEGNVLKVGSSKSPSTSAGSASTKT